MEMPRTAKTTVKKKEQSWVTYILPNFKTTISYSNQYSIVLAKGQTYK